MCVWDFRISRQKNQITCHVERTWITILENDVSPFHSFHRSQGCVIDETLHGSLVFPMYDERDLPHFPSTFAEFPNRTATCFILSASVLDNITSLGIKSTAGRCRHSQYGSSRCGLVIARTRINVCPDDSAIWRSDSIIGSPTGRRLRVYPVRRIRRSLFW